MLGLLTACNQNSASYKGFAYCFPQFLQDDLDETINKQTSEFCIGHQEVE